MKGLGLWSRRGRRRVGRGVGLRPGGVRRSGRAWSCDRAQCGPRGRARAPELPRDPVLPSPAGARLLAAQPPRHALLAVPGGAHAVRAERPRRDLRAGAGAASLAGRREAAPRARRRACRARRGRELERERAQLLVQRLGVRGRGLGLVRAPQLGREERLLPGALLQPERPATWPASGVAPAAPRRSTAAGRAGRRCASSNRTLYACHSATAAPDSIPSRCSSERATRIGCLNMPTCSMSGTSARHPARVSSVRGSLKPHAGRPGVIGEQPAGALVLVGAPAHGCRWRLPGAAAGAQHVLVQAPHLGALAVALRVVRVAGADVAEEQAVLLQRPGERAGAAAVHAEHRDDAPRTGARQRPAAPRRRASAASWPRWPSPACRRGAASAPRARSRAAGSGTCPRTAA